MRYYMDQLIGKDFQLWSLWPKSDTKVRCWPAWVPHTYLARCRFGLFWLLSGPMFGWHQKKTWRSWRLWREWMFVRCPGAFKSVRTPTDDATALSSRRRTCQATNLQIFWSHFEALTQKVPLKKGNCGISITNLSSFFCSCCSCCSYLHRLWDSEIRFIFLVFQVLGAWPPVSCAAFYWCRTSSGRPSVLQLLSWRFIVQLMDFVHRRLIWIIWTL